MKHAAFVGEVDCFSDGLEQLRCVPGRQGLLAVELRQVPPFYEFHGEERLPAMLTDFVNAHDVGMTQARRRFGFTPETFRARRSGSELPSLAVKTWLQWVDAKAP